MEDIEKYIFDPENPKAFKAYGLLRKIIRDDSNVAIVDPLFICELFHDLIWNQEAIDDLWDAPDDINELSGIAKARLYWELYTLGDFYSFIKKRIANIPDSSFYTKGFSNYGNLDIHRTSLPLKAIWKGLNSIVLYSTIEAFKHIDLGRSADIKATLDSNGIFLMERPYFHLMTSIKFHRSSIYIMSVDDYFEDQLPMLPANLTPILLKDYKHLNLLLDFIKRDLSKTTNTNPLKEKSAPPHSFHLQNYFSLKNIELTALSDKKEIYFLGENGDGKTLLLQAMLLALKGNQQEGDVLNFVKQNPHKKLKLEATGGDGKKYQYEEDAKKQKASYSNILGYGVNRFRNDSDQKDPSGYLSLFNNDQFLENPVKWLQHLDYKEAKGATDGVGLRKAIEILKSLLNENVEIEVSPEQVSFIERGTTVQFDQLSDGYRSVIIWVCDLIARFSENQPEAEQTQDFYGVVLVDEIGVFLHPKWQFTIVRKLRSWFPNIQFIFTTHSPIVALGASEDAVFYKIYKEDGETKVMQPVQSIAELTANGLITSPLFGMEHSLTAAFDPKKHDLSTEDDHLSTQIHKVISEELRKRNNNISEAELMDMIKAELDKIEATAQND